MEQINRDTSIAAENVVDDMVLAGIMDTLNEIEKQYPKIRENIHQYQENILINMREKNDTEQELYARFYLGQLFYDAGKDTESATLIKEIEEKARIENVPKLLEEIAAFRSQIMNDGR